MIPESRICDGVVLVVDDEEDTRELLSELLVGQGYHVVTARDGVEALRVLAGGEHVRVVLLDLVMPRLDGFGVLEAMASDPDLRDVRVCVTTSAPDRAPAGVTCLPKPIDVVRLFELMDQPCAAVACVGTVTRA